MKKIKSLFSSMRNNESGNIRYKIFWKTGIILSIVLSIVGTIILNLLINAF